MKAARRRGILIYCLLQVLLGRIELLLKERDFTTEGLVGDFAGFSISQGSLFFGQTRLGLLKFVIEKAKSVGE